MHYLRKIDSWRNRDQKLILKDGDMTSYISAKSAVTKANQEDKDLWQCCEGSNIFYVLREKETQ